MSNPGPAITSTSNLTQDNVPQSDGHMIGASASALIGHYGVGPVVQPSTTGNVHTVAAGSVTAAFVNTTFDGSIGSTAYTIGDIVAALKSIGIMKA
jgi:hypothetical protein